MPGSILKEMYEKHEKEIKRWRIKQIRITLEPIAEKIDDLIYKWKDQYILNTQDYYNKKYPKLMIKINRIYRFNDLPPNNSFGKWCEHEHILLELRITNPRYWLFNEQHDELFKELTESCWKKNKNNQKWQTVAYAQNDTSDISKEINKLKNKWLEEEKIIEGKHKEGLNKLNGWYEREKAKIIKEFKIEEFVLEEE